MGKHDQLGKPRISEMLMGRALLLLFGLGVLGFLVAVERADWQSVRPATQSSITLAKASGGGILGSQNGQSTARP